MNIEDQVLSIEQSKHLQELGLDMSDAALCWNKQTRTWDNKEPSEWRKKWSVIKNQPLAVMNFTTYESIPTYTLQEVLDKLPKKIEHKGLTYKLESDCEHWLNYYTGSDDNRDYLEESNTVTMNLIDSAYNMLCWVIENGYLEENK